jgi:hypothetical protein
MNVGGPVSLWELGELACCKRCEAGSGLEWDKGRGGQKQKRIRAVPEVL